MCLGCHSIWEQSGQREEQGTEVATLEKALDSGQDIWVSGKDYKQQHSFILIIYCLDLEEAFNLQEDFLDHRRCCFQDFLLFMIGTSASFSTYI